jgi:hypothetical protein
MRNDNLSEEEKQVLALLEGIIKAYTATLAVDNEHHLILVLLVVRVHCLFHF